MRNAGYSKFKSTNYKNDSITELFDELDKFKKEVICGSRKIDNFEVNEEVCYEVWALGYSDNNEITDCEILLGEFSDFGEAINYAKNTVTLEVCLEQLAKENNVETFTEGVTYFCIEVQTVIPTADGGTENIDTAWHKIIEI